MSDRRREQAAEARLRSVEQRSQVVNQAIQRLDVIKIPDAPSDGSNYVRVDGAWQIAPTVVPSWGTIVGSLSAQTDLYNSLQSKLSNWESGTAYYDSISALYVVYGADGNWQATKATATSTLSTAAAQSGSKPTTLSALRALSYS